MGYFCEICILGVHRRWKFFNIRERGGGGKSSEVNFNAWGGGGGACVVQNKINTRMHAYIYTHIYTCGCISKIKAIMNGRPFIRNQIYHLSTSERSERGKFLTKVFQTQGGTLIFS